MLVAIYFSNYKGNGECRYLIGVNDNGTLFGLKENELNETLRIINIMAENLNAETRYTMSFSRLMLSSILVFYAKEHLGYPTVSNALRF